MACWEDFILMAYVSISFVIDVLCTETLAGNWCLSINSLLLITDTVKSYSVARLSKQWRVCWINY